MNKSIVVVWVRSLSLLCMLTSFLIKPIDQMPQLSPQEIEQLQQLEAIQQMTPEQRNQFEQDMLAQMPAEERVKYQLFKADLEKKTPDQQLEFLLKPVTEQEAYINNLYTTHQAANPEANPTTSDLVSAMQPTTLAAPLSQEIKEPELPKKTIEPKKLDSLLASFAHIQDATTDFLRRVDSMPDFLGKFDKWLKQGKLHNAKQDTSWAAIRANIAAFEAQLKTLIEKDPVSKDYRYLPDVIEDESLFNNIVHLGQTLKRFHQQFLKQETKEEENEELAAEKAMGLIETSQEMRSIMRSVINAFLEAFERTQIPDHIKKVKEKYDPTAKKHKEFEEGIQKKAFEESKRERRHEFTISGGTRDDMFGGFGPMPAYPGTDYYGGAPLGPLPDSGPSTKQPEDTKKPKEESPKKDGPAPKEPEKQKKEEDKALEDTIKRFRDNLVSAIEEDIQGTSLERIGKHMSDNSSVDPEVPGKLTSAIKKIRAAANTLRSFRKKTEKKGNAGKEYINKINDEYEEFKKPLDDVFAQVSQAKSNMNKASQEKKEAFFSGPYTLDDLQNAIAELRAARAGNAFTPAASSQRITPQKSNAGPLAMPTRGGLQPGIIKQKEEMQKKSPEELKQLQRTTEHVDRIVKRFGKSLDTLFEKDVTDNLANIKEYLLSDEDSTKETKENLKHALQTINKILAHLANLKTKLANFDHKEQAAVKEQIQDRLDDYQATINKFYEDMNWIERNPGELRNVSDAKQQAFLAVLGPKADIEQGYSLYDLKNSLDQLKKIVQEL